MKNTTPTQSYDGEHIYVGIDVHKKTYVVVARVRQTIVKKWSTAGKPVDLAAQLLKYFDGGRIHTVYEAGFSGFVLHRELQQQGIDRIVVHAAAVEVAVDNRVKTDKRDADKLSAQLEAGRLREI
jgi:transposase